MVISGTEPLLESRLLGLPDFHQGLQVQFGHVEPVNHDRLLGQGFCCCINLAVDITADTGNRTLHPPWHGFQERLGLNFLTTLNNTDQPNLVIDPGCHQGQVVLVTLLQGDLVNTQQAQLLHTFPVGFLADPAVNDPRTVFSPTGSFMATSATVLLTNASMRCYSYALVWRLLGSPVQLLPSGGVFVTVLADALLGPDDQVAWLAPNGQMADGTGLGIACERDWFAAFPAFDLIMICGDLDIDTVLFQLKIEDFYTTRDE